MKVLTDKLFPEGCDWAERHARLIYSLGDRILSHSDHLSHLNGGVLVIQANLKRLAQESIEMPFIPSELCSVRTLISAGLQSDQAKYLACVVDDCVFPEEVLVCVVEQSPISTTNTLHWLVRKMSQTI